MPPSHGTPASPYFNSRPSARGDSVRRKNSAQQKKFQFTPLREGRRIDRCLISRIINYTSRPSARGDGKVSPSILRNFYFNSRPSARGDPKNRRHAPRVRISIHAPPRGATFKEAQAHTIKIFQFTPLREGRREFYMCELKRDRFQFTPLREGRRAASTHQPRSWHFNSRPSARGDPPPHDAAPRQRISIHAPPRGATHSGLRSVWNSKFQFTPLREGRLPRRVGRPRPQDFNSRPSARGDVHHHQGNGKNCISIHAPPRGATPLRGGD